MKQKLGKSMLLLRIFTLTALLIGLLIFAPASVRAGSPDGHPVQDPHKIEGQGSSAGTPANLFSPSGVIFQQPPIHPDQDWAAWLSSSDTVIGSILCIDDFGGLSDKIDDIHWYGMALIWDNETSNYLIGDPSGMQFDIVFYADNNGSPGSKVAQFSDISPDSEPYSTYYSDNIGYPVYRFDVSGLAVPAVMTHGWVSIQSTFSPGDSQFLWLISASGNDNAMQMYESNDPTEQIGNLSFALTKALPPVPGLSVWGSIILMVFFSLLLVYLIRSRPVKSKVR